MLHDVARFENNITGSEPGDRGVRITTTENTEDMQKIWGLEI